MKFQGGILSGIIGGLVLGVGCETTTNYGDIEGVMIQSSVETSSCPSQYFGPFSTLQKYPVECFFGTTSVHAHGNFTSILTFREILRESPRSAFLLLGHPKCMISSSNDLFENEAFIVPSLTKTIISQLYNDDGTLSVEDIVNEGAEVSLLALKCISSDDLFKVFIQKDLLENSCCCGFFCDFFSFEKSHSRPS